MTEVQEPWGLINLNDILGFICTVEFIDITGLIKELAVMGCAIRIF